MKKFVLMILLFIGVGALLLSPIIILSQYDNADKDTNLNRNILAVQVKSEFDALDILFVGNSYCYSGVDPKMLEQIGLKTYNLGMATAGPVFYDMLIRDYLGHTSVVPKAVFMLVSPTTFSSKADNFGYPIHRYLDRPLSNLQIARRYHLLRDLVAMYKLSLHKAIGNLRSRPKKSDQSEILSLRANRGFGTSSEIVDLNAKAHAEVKKFYDPFFRERLNENKILLLRKLTDDLKTQGIQVVYFELPSYQLRSFFNETYLVDYEDALNELRQHVPLVRVKEEGFTNKQFRNVDHMNISGAEMATKRLMDIIDENRALFGLD